MPPCVYYDSYEISYLSIEKNIWIQPEIVSLDGSGLENYYGLSHKEFFYNVGFTAFYGEQDGIIISSQGPGTYVEVINVLK